MMLVPTRMSGAVVAMLVGLLVLVGSPAASAQGCAGTSMLPNPRTLQRVEAATLCLVNAQRAKAGLAPWTVHPALVNAARGFSREMVAKRFFDHVSPTGSTLISRVKRAGYLRGARGFQVGENLAWGGGTLASARATVRTWMGSPPHRAAILSPVFAEAGIGIALGTPSGGQGATVTMDVGRRG